MSILTGIKAFLHVREIAIYYSVKFNINPSDLRYGQVIVCIDRRVGCKSKYFKNILELTTL